MVKQSNGDMKEHEVKVRKERREEAPALLYLRTSSATFSSHEEGGYESCRLVKPLRFLFFSRLDGRRMGNDVVVTVLGVMSWHRAAGELEVPGLGIRRGSSLCA